MASISKRITKDGRRFFEIHVSRGRGKSAYQTRWYPPDGWCDKTARREAVKIAADFERRCAAGEVLNRAEKKAQAAQERAEAAKLKTVRQYTESVFMPMKTATIAEQTRSNYRFFLDRVIFPKIGDVLLTEVSPAMISSLILAYQRAGYSFSSVMKIYVLLNGIFESAFMDDSIPVNPMHRVKRPTPRKDEAKDTSVMAYSALELCHIFECLKGEPLKWRAYVTVMADTGARKGEVCGLYWSDVDFDAGTVTIRRNLQYTKAAGVYLTTTKTGRTRIVDVGDDTLSLLRELRARQAASCLSKFVFTTDGTTEPMHPCSPTHYFRRFGQKYGISGFHPHRLRHTSATLAVLAGADISSVSARLGHSNVSTTLKVYAHATQESVRRVGQLVRDALKAQNE